MTILIDHFIIVCTYFTHTLYDFEFHNNILCINIIVYQILNQIVFPELSYGASWCIDHSLYFPMCIVHIFLPRWVDPTIIILYV